MYQIIREDNAILATFESVTNAMSWVFAEMANHRNTLFFDHADERNTILVFSFDNVFHKIRRT